MCVNDFAPPGMCRRLMHNHVMSSRQTKHSVETKKITGADGNLLPLKVHLKLSPRASCK